MFTSPNSALPETTGNRTPMKKRRLAAVLATAAIAVTVPFALAQTSGYGPGMMGGYGGYHGYGMGPGMMGGYGGYGGYGMGSGMMYGYGGNVWGALDLSTDQLEKITKIQQASFTKRWALMGQMREQQFKFRELLASGKTDDAAIGKAFRQIEDLRQQMWAAGAEARKEMDAVLTKEQRDQLRRGWDRDGDAN
ncbi:MAG: Spy/CpxP family protein refolding chaperone [Betaproteobacteria bacterium]